MFEDKEKDGKKKKKQVWTEEQEKLLASWSEKASGYRWLHMRSEKLYRKRNYAFTIPVIILSTLTGTANFAMDSFVPEEHKQVAMACVGGVNIFAGILSTLQNFLRYAELMEGHRVSEVSWSKFSREISVELALEPDMRKPAFDFLTVCRAEFDRLIEQSPTIDDSIIAQYNAKFMKKKKKNKNKSSGDIDKTTSADTNGSPRSVISDGGHNEDEIDHPHVCNGIHKCNIYKPKPEDKIPETLAIAGGKFMENKFNKKWNLDKIHDKVNNIPSASVKNTANNFENKKELEGLKTIGKVKSFKEKINKEEIEDHPAKEIKKIVKAIEEDSFEEEETSVNLTSSEMERLTLDDEDKEMLLNSIKEPVAITETKPEEIIIGDFPEEESLIPPKDKEPQPEPEVVNKVDEIIDDIESNTKETQTEKDEGDVIVDIEEGKSESNDENDLFKEENEIKDFLEKIE